MQESETTESQAKPNLPRRKRAIYTYNPISNESRQALIKKVCEEGISLAQASKDLNINYSSAKTIMAVYRNQGRTEKIPHKLRSFQKKAEKVASKSSKLMNSEFDKKISELRQERQQGNLQSEEPAPLRIEKLTVPTNAEKNIFQNDKSQQFPRISSTDGELPKSFQTSDHPSMFPIAFMEQRMQMIQDVPRGLNWEPLPTTLLNPSSMGYNHLLPRINPLPNFQILPNESLVLYQALEARRRFEQLLLMQRNHTNFY